jgi:hypothetical protein
VSKDVITEAWKHGIWDLRIDERAIKSVAAHGPTFGFTKTDMSAKAGTYVDLSYLAAATEKSADGLAQIGK